MFESMYAAKGIGLAAPQIGISKRITVIDLSFQKNPEEKIVLINPLVYASEGLRASLVPGFPHLSMAAVLVALLFFDLLLLGLGLRQFDKKAVS